jgi:hypothetical protein
LRASATAAASPPMPPPTMMTWRSFQLLMHETPQRTL